MKENQFLTMEADIKRQRLQEICRDNQLDRHAILRVAYHRLYNEDVLQEPPIPEPASIITPYQRALQLAKDATRLEYQANAHKPESIYSAGWWYVPSQRHNVEAERQKYQARKASGISEMDELLMWLGWE